MNSGSVGPLGNSCKKDPARLLKPKGASHEAADQQIFWASLSIFWK